MEILTRLGIFSGGAGPAGLLRPGRERERERERERASTQQNINKASAGQLYHSTSQSDFDWEESPCGWKYNYYNTEEGEGTENCNEAQR